MLLDLRLLLLYGLLEDDSFSGMDSRGPAISAAHLVTNNNAPHRGRGELLMVDCRDVYNDNMGTRMRLLPNHRASAGKRNLVLQAFSNTCIDPSLSSSGDHTQEV